MINPFEYMPDELRLEPLKYWIRKRVRERTYFGLFSRVKVEYYIECEFSSIGPYASYEDAETHLRVYARLERDPDGYYRDRK